MIVIENPKQGDKLDAAGGAYPERLEILEGKKRIGARRATSYGYVISGSAQVKTDELAFVGRAGMFFCIPGEFELDADGCVAIIYRDRFRGLLSGGRIEEAGRLSYLNGCSSTVLIPPPKAGDPVLNHLHIPHGIDQTAHTHPSFRLGIVVGGGGLAYGTERPHMPKWKKKLSEGCVFFLRPGELHAFSTTNSPQGMDLVTYHPDSDWGPTDDNHPMLTATLVEKAG